MASDEERPRFPPPGSAPPFSPTPAARAPSPAPAVAAPAPTARPVAASASAPVVRRPEDKLERGPAPPGSDDEPDLLTRALAADRWPRLMVRFPRVAGIGFLLVGAMGVQTIARLASEGGWYARALPVLTTLGFTNGAWLLIFGRPVNERGYSPEWWNIGWVVAAVVGVLAAFFVYSRFL